MQLSEHTSDQMALSANNQNLEINWSKAFNTSILSTVLDSKSQDGEIEALLDTPEYRAILLAAQNLAGSLNISPEAATERLIQTFRNIDSSWKKVLLKKGAQSLLGL